MPSLIWSRSSQDAIDNPYEYDVQDQFMQESDKILSSFLGELEPKQLAYQKDDKSIEKAIWMLHNDATEALIECHTLLIEKRHKIASRLFRDVIETLDIAAYFHSDTDESSRNLLKWYDGHVIPNRLYRNFVKLNYGEKASARKRELYSQYSKFTHRTYDVLLYSYSLGRDNYLVYDGYEKDSILILPHTIAMYLSLLADLILLLSDELVARQSVSEKLMNEIWSNSLDGSYSQKRFISPREFMRTQKKMV